MYGTALSVLSAIFAAVASWQAWRAIRVAVAPFWHEEPGDPIAANSGWIAAQQYSSLISGRLNRSAALFAGLAALLSIASAAASQLLG